MLLFEVPPHLPLPTQMSTRTLDLSGVMPDTSLPMNARDWIQHLALRPHPEGGYYRESYRAATVLPAQALPRGFKGPRAASTAIFFLLTRGQVSHLHRIRSDEVWHHYDGGTVLIHTLTPEGDYLLSRLGKNPAAGEAPQALVKAGSWFGATLAPRTDFALVGCTVAPGFDFAEFEMAKAGVLLESHPGQAVLIRRLCARQARQRCVTAPRTAAGRPPRRQRSKPGRPQARRATVKRRASSGRGSG